MRRILTPIVLLTLLVPSIAFGHGLICMVTGWNCSEVVGIKDLVERGGLHYKKFSDVPFTGKTTGQEQVTFKNGKKHGPWVVYHKNGQLYEKGTFKDGKQDAPWVYYYEDGTVNKYATGTYKNDWKISD